MANRTRDKRKRLLVFGLSVLTIVLIFLRWTQWSSTDLDSRDSFVDMKVGGDILARKGIRGRSTIETNNGNIFSRVLDPGVRDVSNEEKDIYAIDVEGEDMDNDSSNALFVWPLPKKVVSGPAGGMVSIDPEFSIKSQSPSKVLSAGIARYEALIKKRAYPMDLKGCQKPGVRHVRIKLESDGEDLNLDTSYQYSLMISPETGITIHAASPYGALYGLETFAQLVQEGCLRFSELHIEDYPSFRHRGLLLDTGRRVAPKNFLLNILDAMSFLKLNVFHWHFSDYCVFSIQSKLYPEFTSSLKPGEYYSQEVVKEVVQYARERGIRVIPEMDIPGHARGMKALRDRGLQFCDDTCRQLYNDPRGETLATLKKLVSELASLFPDEFIHLGCDEAREVGLCTLNSTRALETELFKHAMSIGKKPVGWEELLFVSGVKLEGMVVQAWSRYTAKDVSERGFMSIESNRHHFYLDYEELTVLDVWEGTVGGDSELSHVNKLVLGGEFCLWTDMWARNYQCFDQPKEQWPDDRWAPVAYWMSDTSKDDVFMDSAAGMLWPRGIAAAGNFWNPASDVPGKNIQSAVKYQLQVLISRGIMACPKGCSCTVLERCHRSYPK